MPAFVYPCQKWKVMVYSSRSGGAVCAGGRKAGLTFVSFASVAGAGVAGAGTEPVCGDGPGCGVDPVFGAGRA